MLLDDARLVLGWIVGGDDTVLPRFCCLPGRVCSSVTVDWGRDDGVDLAEEARLGDGEGVGRGGGDGEAEGGEEEEERDRDREVNVDAVESCELMECKYLSTKAARHSGGSRLNGGRDEGVGMGVGAEDGGVR